MGKFGSATVAIIGGGFSGAAVALHLARGLNDGKDVRIVVFEPRERLGAGLAYDTTEPAHRINVPAYRMSLYPDEPESFANYLARSGTRAHDPAAYTAEGIPFPRRSVFGDYVAAEIAPLLSSGAIEHRRKRVADVRRTGEAWMILTEDVEPVVADVVVLAVSHPAPSLPKALRPLLAHPKLVADPTKANALDIIAPTERVLVVGNGLTSADVIAALDERGHQGPIVSISRRGLRSRGHPPAAEDPFGDFVSEPITRASELLRRIRQTLRLAAQKGMSWHPVIDAVRAQGQQIWQALPVVERRRITRFTRAHWDVHRFRVAPQVQKVLDQAVESGRLEVMAASIRSATIEAEGIAVELKERRAGAPRRIAVDAVVVTTGPAHGEVLKSQSFLTGLEEAGVLTPCETGLGIACDRDGHALNATGSAERSLFIAGPLARGTFGELMGLPQVTEHAVFVARKVAALLSSVIDEGRARQSAAPRAAVRRPIATLSRSEGSSPDANSLERNI
ncbi:FAD/NAD(P)-binding protein [Sinorhizobium americanum]|uniref:Hydroxyacylglutathione hydrolase n=1 Tax=Sinorhizobium americanum TaxID=194963 RepID=A0A1L3LTV4_9HYPH|nr:FAD/NAD(P)-binding protein [Sinorhizobium americanum]APG93486.1 hydroxyacylglutathione hydrolase [Sinorhizobium americanum]